MPDGHGGLLTCICYNTSPDFLIDQFIRDIAKELHKRLGSGQQHDSQASPCLGVGPLLFLGLVPAPSWLGDPSLHTTNEKYRQ